MNELKFLRKLEFPDSITEALRILERLCINEATQTSPQLDLLNSITEEFVFLEIDRRGNKRRLPPVKELQVLEKLITYFSDSKNDPQNLSYVFLYLFMPGKILSETRLSILTKLVSLALADVSPNILHYMGMWMQMSDCKSEHALHITDIIVKDYFLLMPSLSANLETIPLNAPLFCSSFLSCLTIMYEPFKKPPPQKITELALNWLKVSPFLCFAPLKMASSQKTFVPSTPIPGLLQWCVLSPLTNNENTDDLLFSQLHLTILETVVRFNQREPLNPLMYMVIPHFFVLNLVEILKKFTSHQNIQLSLDRLAQATEISLSSKCLQYSPDLMTNLTTLPQTRLMKIIIDKWNVQK